MLDFRVNVYQPQVAVDGPDPDHCIGLVGFGVDPGPTILLPHVTFDPRSLLGYQHVGG